MGLAAPNTRKPTDLEHIKLDEGRERGDEAENTREESTRKNAKVDKS